MQGPADWNPAPKEIRETCKRAVKYAADHGIELPELAIKGVVATNVDISTHLVRELHLTLNSSIQGESTIMQTLV